LYKNGKKKLVRTVMKIIGISSMDITKKPILVIISFIKVSLQIAVIRNNINIGEFWLGLEITG